MNQNFKEEKIKKLFLASLKGDEVSYQHFLMEVSILLGGYLKKSIGRRYLKEDTDDLVQEILISIHRKRDLFDTTKKILPWLYAVARYRLIDSIRSTIRGPALIELLDNFDSGLLVDEEVSNLRGENNGSNLLDGLSDIQKNILWLAKVEGMPLIEIAQETKLSHSLVKVSIHRALKSLRARSKR